MDELKPCPFCGEIPNVNVIYPSSRLTFIRKPINLVGCRHCGIDISYNPAFWNTRPAEDALKAEVERLKVDLDARNSALKIAFHDIKRAGEEIDKWQKMFYDLIYKQSSVSTDPKVIVIGKDSNAPTKESEGEDE